MKDVNPAAGIFTEPTSRKTDVVYNTDNQLIHHVVINTGSDTESLHGLTVSWENN